MGRHVQLVIGPAGVGKSTYCKIIAQHIRQSKRSCVLVNLDPAAEDTFYDAQIDIRDLVSLQDVMEELDLGPNGGLIYAMEYLIEEFEWLEEQVGGPDTGDEYFIVDFPGQLELFTYGDVVRKLISMLTQRLHFQCCAVYLLESSFTMSNHKFFSGVLAAMSCMVGLEIPHINVLSKMDLVEGIPGEVLKKQGFTNPAFNEDDCRELFPDVDPDAPKSGYANTWTDQELEIVEDRREQLQLERYLEVDTSLLGAPSNDKYSQLNQAIVGLIEEFGLVNFFPLNIHDEDSIEKVLYQVDQSLQYGEDVEPKDPLDLVQDPIDFE